MTTRLSAYSRRTKNIKTQIDETKKGLRADTDAGCPQDSVPQGSEGFLMRRRFFVHARGNFEDETAYVMYRGHQAYLVTCSKVDRELRSDEQRAGAGVWKELTPKGAALVLQKKPLQPIVISLPKTLRDNDSSEATTSDKRGSTD